MDRCERCGKDGETFTTGCGWDEEGYHEKEVCAKCLAEQDEWDRPNPKAP